MNERFFIAMLFLGLTINLFGENNEDAKNEYLQRTFEQIISKNKNINKVPDTVNMPSNMLQDVSQVAGILGVAVSVLSFCSNTISSFWTSDEQKYKNAFKALNECLTDHKNKAKDDEGMPLACEEVIDEYTRIAGFEALNQIKSAYVKKGIGF